MSTEYILTMVMCVHIISRDLLAVCAGLLFAAGVSDLGLGSFEDILCGPSNHSRCEKLCVDLPFACKKFLSYLV